MSVYCASQKQYYIHSHYSYCVNFIRSSVAQWLRHYATYREVAVSTLDKVIF
jgi:hypothetical protein